MNLLFICSKNRLRSPTAEAIFSGYPDIEAIGAGTNADSETPVSGDLIEWADVIFAMERSHKRKITQQHLSLLKDKKVAVLDIPDRYPYMDSELIALLKRRVAQYLPSQIEQ
ncbi:MAG: phosphotyrosine protein phosphatase [Spirulina sp. SIO3F2]|nr:phosphotyrosine protein phosphatase [Spirulina sp. SIO3F2]